MIAEVKISVMGVIGITTSMLAVLSDQVILAILTLIGTAISAGVTVVLALKGTNRKLDDQKKDIAELKESTNGKLDALAKATSRADLAEGKAAGKAEEKLEAAAGANAVARKDATAPAPDTKQTFSGEIH